MRRALALALLAAPLVASCGDDTGDAVILLEAEESITDGVAAGQGRGEIVDGWTATFSKYVVALGPIEMARSTHPGVETDASERVLDLRSVPEGSLEVATFSGLAAGRWDLFSYRLVVATNETARDASVSEADFARMVSEGCTYLVQGTLTKPGGESCPPGGACRAAETIAFDLCVPAAVQYESCVSETGIPGLPVTAGSSRSASITLHGDHLFFPGFPAGSENVMRRAQWLADSDVDGDGTVTRTELEGLTAKGGLLSTLLPADEYALSSPPFALENAWQYVRSQMVTQGHFQGEGECVWFVN